MTRPVTVRIARDRIRPADTVSCFAGKRACRLLVRVTGVAISSRGRPALGRNDGGTHICYAGPRTRPRSIRTKTGRDAAVAVLCDEITRHRIRHIRAVETPRTRPRRRANVDRGGSARIWGAAIGESVPRLRRPAAGNVVIGKIVPICGIFNVCERVMRCI